VNVSVTAPTKKTLVNIQGYNDLTALDFANVNLGALTGLKTAAAGRRCSSRRAAGGANAAKRYRPPVIDRRP
jgi:hypothetical protein